MREDPEDSSLDEAPLTNGRQMTSSLSQGLLRRRPRPSGLVVLSVAVLVVGVGGTSVAAAKIATRDLVNGAVTSVKVKDGTVRGVDVRDGSIRRTDLAPGARTAGPRGPQGPAGPPGAAGTARWVLVDADGNIEAQSGGFSIASAYDRDLTTPPGAVGNVYLDANEDLSDNAVVAGLAMQNQVDQNADGITNGRSLNPDANPEFSGEVTASMCGIASVISCAPTGTNTPEHLVVSPRTSDGQVTRSTDRKRFYVVVSGDSSDLSADAVQ